jgi:hypothetical protein
LAEESREPAAVAGVQAAQDGPEPAGGASSVPVPAAPVPADVVPAAREPESVEETQKSAEDEHAELERLRTEVRELREQAPGQGDGEEDSQGGPRGKARPGRWRAVVAAVAITLGCVLAPVSVLGVWAANQVSNTDRYVANMAPLINQPPIQQALSARITTQIESRLDPRINAATTQAAAQLKSANLPRLSNLITTFSGQISSGINSAVAAGVSRAVASPQFAALWTQLNRVAHQGVVRVLSGQGGGAVDVVNNQVVLNLGPLIAQVKDYLVTHGLSIASNIPAVNATYPLFQAPNLAKAQQGYRLITTLRWVLPFLALALMGVGIYVARRHRRALIGAALGLSASMLVLGIALAIARGIYLNSLPKSVSSDAAAALYDTLVRFIRQGLRVLLVVGLVIAAAAFLVGPSVTAVRTRHAVKSGIDWVRFRGEQAGMRTGPVGTWTAAHKTILRVGAVVIAGLIFVFWGQPSVALVIWLVVLLLVALGIIELLGGRPATPETVQRQLTLPR